MTEAVRSAPGTVGDRLREAREEQGQSLDDIGRATRVPVRHLAQIEAGNLEGLPAAPYSAGFVKAYAQVVGLDSVALSQQFRGEFDQARHRTARVPYEPYEPADPSRLPPRLLAIVALAIAVLLVAGYAIWRSGMLTGDGPVTRARLAANGSGTVPALAPPPAATAAAPTVSPPAPAAGGAVVVTAKSDSWIKISERTGATLFIGTLAAGKSFPIPATANDPVIRTGKPEGLAITVGGRTIAPLGKPAHVISNVSLKGDALLAHGPGAAPGAPTATSDTAPAAAAGADVPAAFANTMGH